MGYNRISGSIIAPDYFGPGDGQVGDNILSGNLSTSDGSSIINVPRVSNAGDNRLVTGVGSDANTFTCESALTFDGGTGVLSVTGEITASVGVSASYFEGDGSRLTGISVGGLHGIFTEIDSSKAYTTSSIQVGSNATPTHTMSVEGTTLLSGSVDVDGHMLPTLPDTYDLGSADFPWRSLYVSSSTIYLGTDTLSVGPDQNLKFGSGSTTKGFDVGFMNFKNNGIFMDQGRLFKLRAYQIQMFGGIGYVRKVVADDYTIQDIDYLVGVQSNSLTASVTLTLPQASDLLNGQTYVVKDEGGSVDTYEVNIVCQNPDTIDGQNSIVLKSPYASIQIYCNGNNKYFVF